MRMATSGCAAVTQDSVPEFVLTLRSNVQTFGNTTGLSLLELNPGSSGMYSCDTFLYRHIFIGNRCSFEKWCLKESQARGDPQRGDASSEHLSGLSTVSATSTSPTHIYPTVSGGIVSLLPPPLYSGL